MIDASSAPSASPRWTIMMMMRARGAEHYQHRLLSSKIVICPLKPEIIGVNMLQRWLLYEVQSSARHPCGGGENANGGWRVVLRTTGATRFTTSEELPMQQRPRKNSSSAFCRGLHNHTTNSSTKIILLHFKIFIRFALDDICGWRWVPEHFVVYYFFVRFKIQQ